MVTEAPTKQAWSIWMYLLIIAAVGGSYAVYAMILGLPILAGESESIVPLQTGMWAALMTGCLAALARWTAHTTELRVVRILGELPFREGGGLDQIRGEWQAFNAQASHQRRVRGWSIGGWVSGLLFSVLAIAMTIDAPSTLARFLFSGWFIAVLPFLFGYTTKHVYQNVVGTKFIMRQAVELTDIDVLRPQRQIAFARLALRNGLGWIVALTVTLMLTLGDQVSTVGMVPLFLGTGYLAVMSFWGPMHVVHTKLVSVKAVELERLATLIVTARQDMEAGSDMAGSRLAGLLAWRQAVADAKEWPTDAGTTLRLFLYLAIPLGGWVGSALVEYLLEFVL